ncbi:MAG TPA: B12-binding domain-containing protein [Dermatophilaceae bacterium]|nr:B12-binding domain-containing protein [Dermatophilaceae bacterium]
MIDVEAYLARYLAAVHGGDRREAIDVTLALVQQGVSAERVITDLLSRAQTEIGLGWQEGRWSVATEHRASDITESALHAVVQSALNAPGAVREGSGGRVVVTCSESEWHVLPGRMAAGVLRLRGFDVTFIGPSVPADELSGFLDDDLPGAVALTCSMPMSLVGAWRSIGALRAIGLTIVCGGRGFGSDGRWGLALGADHWAPDFAAGADVLLSVLDDPAPAPREPVGAPERIAEVRILSRTHETLVEEATQAAWASCSAVPNSDAAMRETREDLAATLRVIAAATLVDDLSLVTDYVHWFEEVFAARELPRSFVSTSFEVLQGALPAELAYANKAARAGVGACRSDRKPFV